MRTSESARSSTRLLIIILVLVTAFIAAMHEPVERETAPVSTVMACSVNGEIITEDQVLSVMSANMDQTDEGNREMADQVRMGAVDFLVSNSLLMSEARSRGIVIGEDEVDAILDDRDLEQRGDEAQDRKQARYHLTGEALFESIKDEVNVSESEVREFYDSRKADGGMQKPPSRMVAHIMVDDESTAQRIFKQVKRDASSFEDLAIEWSTDYYGSREDISFEVYKDDQDETGFSQTALGLDTGEVSEPIETDFGWHIIMALEDIDPEREVGFEEISADIEEHLLFEKAGVKMMEVENEMKESANVECSPGYEWEHEIPEMTPDF